ncbi:MAG: PQQ-like beta-propeller repeat protein [Candidatus Omnitrophica bacterium]|nr:PQQ-like beta-propeller repeat protein [Candidatus Omnitrophota bacterium]
MRFRHHNLIFFLLLTSVSACAVEWPQWFGPNRDGNILVKNWKPEFAKQGPELLWRFRAGIGYSPVSVQDGLAFTMGYQDGEDVVYCLDAETGEEKWSYSYPCGIHDFQHEGGPACAPLIENGLVYTMSRDCDAFCFNAKTGDIVWSASAQANIHPATPLFGYIGAPAMVGDRLILDVGAIVALDKKTGERIWQSEETFKATCSSPTPFELDGKSYAAVFNATGLVIVDVETGHERWRKPWRTPAFDTNTGTPLVKGNRIFITSGFDGGAALLELSEDHEPIVVWENQDLRSRNNTPRLYEDHLYYFDIDTLRCLEFETGKEKWSEDWIGVGTSILVNNCLLTLSERGEVVFVEATPEEYRELGRFHLMGGTCWTPPAFAENKLYLRNSKGHVSCFDMRPLTKL